MDLRKKAEELAARPYIVQVIKDITTDDQPVFVALSPELEGCMGQGETNEKAIMSLREARIDYIESLLEDSIPVPEPQSPATITTSSQTTTFTYIPADDKPLGKWTVVKNDPYAYVITKLFSSS